MELYTNLRPTYSWGCLLCRDFAISQVSDITFRCLVVNCACNGDISPTGRFSGALFDVAQLINKNQLRMINLPIYGDLPPFLLVGSPFWCLNSQIYHVFFTPPFQNAIRSWPTPPSLVPAATLCNGNRHRSDSTWCFTPVLTGLTRVAQGLFLRTLTMVFYAPRSAAKLTVFGGQIAWQETLSKSYVKLSFVSGDPN